MEGRVLLRVSLGSTLHVDERVSGQVSVKAEGQGQHYSHASHTSPAWVTVAKCRA